MSLVDARDSFYESARFADVFADLKRAPRAIERRLAEIPGVSDAEATVAFDATIDVAGVAEPVIGRMIGLPADGPSRLNRLVIRRGRAPEPGRAGEAVVSEGFAAARRLAPGDTVGALLNGRRETLSIVGIGLSPEYIFATSGGAFPDDRNFGVFWVDRERLATAYDMEGAFNHVTLRLAPGASERAVIAALDALLEPWGGLNAHGRDEQLSHRILAQEINQWKVTGTVIPTIFLAVAAFLLNVVLGRQVATQREQIAALKALGYANGALMRHYLLQVGVIVALGIALGIGAGIWFGEAVTGLYAEFFHFPAYRLPPAAVGRRHRRGDHRGRRGRRDAGRGPAGRGDRTGRGDAAAVPRGLPADADGAARPRTPAHAGDADDGEQHGAAVGARAADHAGDRLRDGDHHLRHVLARRARLHDRGAVRGRAAGRRGDRAGRGVGSRGGRRDRPASGRDVRRGLAERGGSPRRGPPQLSHRDPGPAARRRAAAAARCRVARDRGSARGPAAHRPAGRAAGVRPGDTLRVEVLTGRRNQRDATVAGTVHDLIGLFAYMDRDALGRLAGDAGTVSSVATRLDPAQAGALFARLKEFPRVAIAASKTAMLANFRETSARNVLFFTAILTGFAAMIAIGVVYNNARIALQERTWELASLRVLGFTRGEVSTFLLGELALEILDRAAAGRYPRVLAVVGDRADEPHRHDRRYRS